MTAGALACTPEILPAGASTVPTQPFEAVQVFGRQIISMGRIMCVTGDPGTGKTYATDCFAASLDVLVVKLHLGDRARGHEVLRALLETLGEPAGARGRLLLENARESLTGRQILIYVDEAHLLNREALRQLRWLYDQRGMRFGLVMTGVSFAEAFAKVPEFDSRVARRVHFTRLDRSTLVPSLAAMHPILAATDPDLLRSIDSRYCSGLWRHWRNVLETAVGYGATPESGLTEKIAAAVVAAITGGR